MRIEQLTVNERLTVISNWSKWFYDNTESFEGEIGMQLAYLWPAVVSGEQMAADENSAIVRLLRYKQVSVNEIIWDYLLIEPEDVEEF